MAYDFDPNLETNEAFKFTPILKIEGSDYPEIHNSWLDELSQIVSIEKKCFLKHVNSSYSYRKELKNSLSIIYRRLTGQLDQQLGGVSKNEKENISTKLIEGIDLCTAGFHNRVESILLSFHQPKNIFELLFKVRMSLVESVAAQLATGSQGVHTYNTVFKIASLDKLGTTELRKYDSYYGDLNEDKIRTTLQCKFTQEYRALRLPDLMCDELRNIFASLGYEGKKEGEGYTVSFYNEAIEYFKALISNEIKMDDFYVLDKQSLAITDINWDKVRKTLFDVMRKRNIILKDRDQIIPKDLIDYAQYLEFLENQDPFIESQKEKILALLEKNNVSNANESVMQEFSYIAQKYPCFFTALARLLNDLTFLKSMILLLAAKRGHTPIVQVLLEEGANPNMQDEQGQTALIYALKSERKEDTVMNIVQALLDEGADPNMQDEYGSPTALMWAAKRGDAKIVQKLLDRGADLNMKDGCRQTAMVYASNHKHREIVLILAKQMSTLLGYLNQSLWDRALINRKAKYSIRNHTADWCHQNKGQGHPLEQLILFFDHPSSNIACDLALNVLIQSLSQSNEKLISTINTLLENIQSFPKHFVEALADIKVQQLQLHLKEDFEVQKNLESIKQKIQAKEGKWLTWGLFSNHPSSKPRSAQTILRLIEAAKKSGYSKEALFEIGKILVVKSNGINPLTTQDTKTFYKDLYQSDINNDLGQGSIQITYSPL